MSSEISHLEMSVVKWEIVRNKKNWKIYEI